MANNKNLGNRIESEAKACIRITNDQLICKGCLYRYDDSIIFRNTSKCEVYPECKPTKILLGGECDEYIKE